MSTEEPPEDLSEETPGHTDTTTTARKRRRSLAIATVAAAVLVVGGGGAYWASTASDDDGSHDGGRSNNPAPLALDAYQAGDREGIAPGEPSPDQRGYRAAEELPDLPRKTAPVYRTAPKVSRADVERLAKALRVSGQPRLERGVWKVGGTPDRMTPTLRVKETGAGGWSFTKFGAPGGDGCLEPPHTMEDDADSSPSGPQCGSLRDGTSKGGTKDAGRSRDAKGPKDAPATIDGGSDPVSAAEAKEAAQPVLEALGQGDAKLDASRTYGAIRSVTADPTFDGLPSYGWQTTLEVGVDGEVAGANGFLNKLTKGDEYPVIGAEDAISGLNTGAGNPSKPSIGGCASTEPLAPDVDEDGGTASDKREIAPCEPAPGAEPTTQWVHKATFGLGMRFAEGRQVLVPSWIFRVRPADAKDGEADFTVTYPAVDPKYLTGSQSGPGAPSTGEEGHGTDPGTGPSTEPEKQIESYSVQGKELTVRFYGGVCSTYTATADPSSSKVTVRVTGKQKPNVKCVLMAKEMQRTITLDEPLGDRAVVDAVSGKPVPKDAPRQE